MGALLPFFLIAAVTAARRSLHTWPHRRRWAYVVATLFLLSPLAMEFGSIFLSATSVGLALAFSIKVADLHAGRVDPATLQSWWRFVVWFVIPPRTRWPDDAQARKQVRRMVLRRWARLGCKAVLLLALLRLNARHVWPWPLGIWAAAFQVYFIISGFSDLVTGTAMLVGFDTQEVFAAPFLARSPADFWGCRWNLFVSDFFRRHIFRPLAKGGHTFAAAFAVFLLSGLAHEYFVFVCVSRDQFWPGLMTAFFLIQGLAVIAAAWLRSHLRPIFFVPTPLKIASHFLWLAATVWLFIKPLDPGIIEFERLVRPLLQFS